MNIAGLDQLDPKNQIKKFPTQFLSMEAEKQEDLLYHQVFAAVKSDKIFVSLYPNFILYSVDEMFGKICHEILGCNVRNFSLLSKQTIQKYLLNTPFSICECFFKNNYDSRAKLCGSQEKARINANTKGIKFENVETRL